MSSVAAAVPAGNGGGNSSIGDSSSSSSSTTSIRSLSVDAETDLLPYYILEHGDGKKSKALFLVPSSLVSRLTLHPILCRGSAFCLRLDNASRQSSSMEVGGGGGGGGGGRHEEESDIVTDRNNSNTSPTSTTSSSASTTPTDEAAGTPRTAFLSIEYESPYPEAVALEIAKRLTKRVFVESTTTSSSSSSSTARGAAAMILGL
jgi:hypothetical protein